MGDKAFQGLRVGCGYDVHRLVTDRKLVIGGVVIPHEKGLLGHSDADVLLHAICDALLGAAGLGDIGQHFPPSDEKFKDVDSSNLLKEVAHKIWVADFKSVINIDAVIMCDQPKMAPHISEMQKKIAKILGVDIARVNIKATTTEKLGFVGREEGIAASAVCLISSDG